MELTYFRLVDPHHPVPLAFAVSEDYVLVLFNTSYISVYSASNISHIVTYPLNDHQPTCLTFFNSDILLIGTNKGSILVFDVSSGNFYEVFICNNVCKISIDEYFGISILDKDNTIYELEISCKTTKKTYNYNKIASNDNLDITDVALLAYKNFNIENHYMSYKSQLKVTSLLRFKGNLIFVDEKGFFKIIRDGSLTKEFFIDNLVFNTINNIKNDNIFVLSSNDGAVLLIDTNEEIILDGMQARKTPIRSLAVNNSDVFFSGDDGRLQSLEVLGDSFRKGNQTENHSGKVVSVVLQRNRILTLSEDKSIGILMNHMKGYVFNRTPLFVGLFINKKEFVVVNNTNSLEIYNIEKNKEIICEQENVEINKKTNKENDIEISELDALEDFIKKEKNPKINISDLKNNDKLQSNSKKFIEYFKKSNYIHLARFKSNHLIVAFDFTKKCDLIAFSNLKTSKIYKKTEKGYKKISQMQPLHQIKFFKNKMVGLTYNKTILFFNIFEKKVIKEIKIGSMDEKIVFCEDFILLLKEKIIFDENLEESMFLYNTKLDIEHVLHVKRKNLFFFLEKIPNFNKSNTQYSLVSFYDGEYEDSKNEKDNISENNKYENESSEDEKTDNQDKFEDNDKLVDSKIYREYVETDDNNNSGEKILKNNDIKIKNKNLESIEENQKLNEECLTLEKNEDNNRKINGKGSMALNINNKEKKLKSKVNDSVIINSSMGTEKLEEEDSINEVEEPKKQNELTSEINLEKNINKDDSKIQNNDENKKIEGNENIEDIEKNVDDESFTEENKGVRYRLSTKILFNLNPTARIDGMFIIHDKIILYDYNHLYIYNLSTERLKLKGLTGGNIVGAGKFGLDKIFVAQDKEFEKNKLMLLKWSNKLINKF